MTLQPLTAQEREMGWVEFHCDAHGGLVATTPNASVFCRCGKRARRLRSGRIVDRETLKPTRAQARTTNLAGHPFVHGCGDCWADFGGTFLLKRHRVGGKLSKRCLSMEKKGWHVDEKARWRADGAYSADKARPPTGRPREVRPDVHR